jgi:cell division septum initiation protein DivIVA
VGDARVEERAKAIIAGLAAETATTEHPVVAPRSATTPTNALQVLTMAQRTAADHLAAANGQADKIRDDAQATADQILHDAKADAQEIRREAEKVLAEARAAAQQAADDLRKQAAEAKSTADQVVAEARAQAAGIGQEAREHADELQQRAQQKYDDSVGSLTARREALQQQIEALERFDGEYRARLASFMQGQLRALWPDRPQVTDGPEVDESAAASPPQNQPTADGRARGASPAGKPANGKPDKS